jgi:hypothetical protein
MRETLEAARKFISDELDNATLSGASPTALSASPSHDSPPLYLPRGGVNLLRRLGALVDDGADVSDIGFDLH